MFLYFKKFYFAFFHSHLLNCLTIWSAIYKSYLRPLRKLQSKAMRVISNMQWSSNSDPLFRKNKILKLEDLVKLETSKLMVNFDRCKLPNSFTKYFKKVSQIYSRVTRSSDNTILYLPRYRSNRLQRSPIYIEELKFGMMFHVIKKKYYSLYNFGYMYKRYILNSYS